MISPTSTTFPGDLIHRFCLGQCARTCLHVLLVAIGLTVSVGWLGCDKSADSKRPLRQSTAGSPSGSGPRNTAPSNDTLDANATHSDSLSQLRKSRPAWFTDRDDPSSDGWDSEVFSQAASAQLKALAKVLSHPEQVVAADVEQLVAAEFSCAPLRQTDLEVVFQDPSLMVSRSATSATSRPAADPIRNQGSAALAEALRELVHPLVNADQVRAKFKLFRVTPEDGSVTTQAYYEASGRADIGSSPENTSPQNTVQQNALWTCRWKPAAEGQPPLLMSIDVEDYEEVATQGTPSHLFSDCSQAVLGQNRCFSEQLMYGEAHWLKRIQATLGINNFGHHGLTVGDIDGDGLEDVYVPQTGGLPNRLFRQNADGTATDVAAQAGVDFMERTNAALLLDLDDDGDQDSVLAMSASILMLENDGTGHFTRVAELRVPNARALASADFDNDGDLDLYVCNYVEVSLFEQNAGFGLAPIPYHDANNGAANALYRNDGEWKFTDVTGDVGLEMNNRRWSFAACWEDYDNDEDVDLYVANDFGRNNLYRNDEGQFTDVALSAGVEDMAAGMSVSWGDYNRDGWMDLYVGNMFSAAGNRVTFQRKFQGEVAEDTKAQFQRLARGNTLFLNAGDGTFRDVSQPAAVTMGRWAWGSVFVDVNNDGWEDLVVANGYFTNEDPDDL